MAATPAQIDEVVQAWSIVKVVIGPVLTLLGTFSTAALTFGVKYLRDISLNLGEMKVEQGKILTHVENHERRITNLEEDQ